MKWISYENTLGKTYNSAVKTTGYCREMGGGTTSTSGQRLKTFFFLICMIAQYPRCTVSPLFARTKEVRDDGNLKFFTVFPETISTFQDTRVDSKKVRTNKST